MNKTLLALAFAASTLTGYAKTKHIPFQALNAEQSAVGIRNPERGFRLETAVNAASGKDVWQPEKYPSPTAYLNEEILHYASDSASMVQCYFYLTDYSGRKLDTIAFRNMQVYFDRLRQAGMKAVLRFAYETDFAGRASNGPTETDIITHLDQLKPFLERNKDLIFVMQAGLIGAWGEWHSSKHGLENSEQTRRNILTKALWATPAERFLQVRVPVHKELIDSASPDYARISFHDDMIIIKPHKWDGDMHEGTPYFAQIARQGRTVPVDGELPWGNWSTGTDPDDSSGWIVEGTSTARQLFLEHFSTLSLIHNYKEKKGDIEPGDYSMMHWKRTPVTPEYLREQGMPLSENYFLNADGTPAMRTAFDYIRDHLGYRLDLQALKIEGDGRKKPLRLDLSLINRGFATLFNEHEVHFVLVSPDGRVTEFPTGADVHGWYPYAAGGNANAPLTHHVRSDLNVPATVPPGEYKLGLWITDGSPRLKYDARYAVRCANDLPWWVSPDRRYGINILTTVKIK